MAITVSWKLWIEGWDRDEAFLRYYLKFKMCIDDVLLQWKNYLPFYEDRKSVDGQWKDGEISCNGHLLGFEPYTCKEEEEEKILRKTKYVLSDF